jgi:hypothetical protein
MTPEIFAGERGERFRSVSDEAAGGMGIEPEEERDKQVMRVPKRLERLLPDFMMCCCVHQQHAKQHNVTRDRAGLCVMDLGNDLGSYLGPLDVIKTADCQHDYLTPDGVGAQT